ncbi:WbqC family protein [Marinobacter mangrovi]|uniref:WbqC family protein n=1 Tax=Marinobacter mangrovi TaxID=2803918 RepID=UPI00193175B3|nr:WbqC family protein [Marinobacter mangrovi]
MRLAIMQPYFFPYIGYFRLLKEADVFLLFDNVQFPRRGWVHRNRGLINGDWVWVTLPLQKAAQSTEIRELRFREAGLPEWIDSQKRRLEHAWNGTGEPIESLPWPETSELPVDYLERSIRWMSAGLGLTCDIVRSSSVLPSLGEGAGEDKILKLAGEMGASEYLNLPGGVGLYHEERFSEAGLRLRFLDEPVDSYESTLFRSVRSGFGMLANSL